MATPIKSEYKRTLLVGDVTIGSTIAVVSSNYTEVFTVKVPVSQRMFWGNGRINLGVDDRGTLKLQAKTAADADIPGVWRFELKDANGIVSRFIREDLQTDTTSGVKVGKGGATGNEGGLFFAKENEYLVAKFKSTAASATIDSTKGTYQIPVTVQAL